MGSASGLFLERLQTDRLVWGYCVVMASKPAIRTDPIRYFHHVGQGTELSHVHCVCVCVEVGDCCSALAVHFDWKWVWSKWKSIHQRHSLKNKASLMHIKPHTHGSSMSANGPSQIVGHQRNTLFTEHFYLLRVCYPKRKIIRKLYL